MTGRGKHRLPVPARLLTLAGAGLVAVSTVLATGSASAHDNTRNDVPGSSEATRDSAADSGEGSDDRGEDNDPKDAQAQSGHNHDSGKPASDQGSSGPNNGLEIVGRDCANSDLELHDGFEKAPRCVSTSFGEVSAANKNPSLLITSAPRKVRSGERFTITVSTRNLIRDRFLAAADGGYYLERSELTRDGIQRGHFHTACRMLASTNVAPKPDAEPAAFIATEDGRGGARPDTVSVRVDGLPGKGIAQCAVWAGDGSHRIPMMQRANEIPAFDTVRITVQ